MKTQFLRLSVFIHLFITGLAHASGDPFAPLGDIAEDTSKSLMDIAMPIFIMAFVALIILRALNIIGNRLLMIATVCLASLAIVPTFVEWMLEGV